MIPRAVVGWFGQHKEVGMEVKRRHITIHVQGKNRCESWVCIVVVEEEEVRMKTTWNHCHHKKVKWRIRHVKNKLPRLDWTWPAIEESLKSFSLILYLIKNFKRKYGVCYFFIYERSVEGGITEGTVQLWSRVPCLVTCLGLMWTQEGTSLTFSSSSSALSFGICLGTHPSILASKGH